MKNIAKIIEGKNTPIGLFLYSPIVGTVSFCGISGPKDLRTIVTIDSGGVIHKFSQEGFYIHPTTMVKSLEVMLFPGRNTRNWDYYEASQSSFAFKKGDLIRSQEDHKVYEVNEVHHSRYSIKDVSSGQINDLCISDQRTFSLLPKPKFNVGDQIVLEREYWSNNVIAVVPSTVISVNAGHYVINGQCGEDDWILRFDNQHQYRLHCPRPLYDVGDKVLDSRDEKVKYISCRNSDFYHLLPKSKDKKFNRIKIESQSELSLLKKALPFKEGDVIVPIDESNFDKLFVAEIKERTDSIKVISFLSNLEHFISFEHAHLYALYNEIDNEIR